MRSEQEMKRIYEICKQCPMFNPGGGYDPGYDQCDICKCNLD